MDIPAASGTPSLYPINLPYKVQHLILTTTQRPLKECCFDFAMARLPLKLQENGWDCFKAVELTNWTKTLPNWCGLLPKDALDLNKRTLIKQVLFSTHNLRHSAVHRLPTSTRGICQIIKSALRLAKMLQVPLHTTQLEELHHKIEARVKCMELNKNFLEDRLNKDLQEIRRQHKELNKKEKELITLTLREDQENKSLMGVLLQESLREISCDDQGDAELKDEIPEISDSGSQTALKEIKIYEKEFQ